MKVFCTDRRKWITSAARRCSRCSKPSRKKTGVVPQPDPFGYIKRLQEEFPYEKIAFSNDYYDTLGLERPDGTTPEWVENGTREVEIEICFRTEEIG